MVRIVTAMNRMAITAAVHSRLQIGASFFSNISSMVATLRIDSSMPAIYSAVPGLCSATHLRSSPFDLSFKLYRSLVIIHKVYVYIQLIQYPNPLEVFVGFASIASHLPSDAGAAMAEMNQDAREIQNAILEMATAIYIMIIMLFLSLSTELKLLLK